MQYLIESRTEGQLHSGQLCQALLRLVQSRGVTILNNIDITGFEKVSGHLLLHTQHPFPLIASQLLVCTNGFARQRLPQLDITPARGQVLVTSPIDRLPFKGTFHFGEGYYYFRNLGERVLLGGARNHAFEEETTTDMTLTDTIQQELERFLRDIVLPGRHYTIDTRWSGIWPWAGKKCPSSALSTIRYLRRPHAWHGRRAGARHCRTDRRHAHRQKLNAYLGILPARSSPA